MAQEKTFENKIKKFLKDNGCWYIKYWSGGGCTRSGIPDLLTCVNGWFVAVEVKAVNGHPTELQLVQLEKIRQAGGTAILLYPKHFDEFKKFILWVLDGGTPADYNKRIGD